MYLQLNFHFGYFISNQILGFFVQFSLTDKKLSTQFGGNVVLMHTSDGDVNYSICKELYI